jgi:hypothetical protein
MSFESSFHLYPVRRRKHRAQAERSYKAQVKTVADDVALESAVRNYAREVEILELEDRFVLLASTFFNERWRDYVDGVWIAPRPRKLSEEEQEMRSRQAQAEEYEAINGPHGERA